MTKHIGIVACSAEGAALCYRTICAEGPRLLGRHAHPEISMHTPSLANYVACLERGDLSGVGELMLGSAEKLARAGADFLICPDNTIHQAFEQVRKRSPLPWLHIGEIVAQEAQARGYRRAAVLGTRWLMESRVYPDALEAVGLEWAVPDAPARADLNRLIVDELVNGVFRIETATRIGRVIETMRRSGCDVVILGCTELPLIVDEADAALPALDSTRLLARAALEFACVD